ncbi:hypothetical protein V8D89_005319 [Ganoderma adspersum]
MRALAHSVEHTRRNSAGGSFLVYVLDPDASGEIVLDPSGQAAGDSLGGPQTDLETATASMPEPGPVSSEAPHADEQASTGTTYPSTTIESGDAITPTKSTAVSQLTASGLISEPATPLPPSKTAGVLPVSEPVAASVTTTASSTAPIEGSSSSTDPAQTSRFDSAQPSSTHPPGHNGLGLYAGITFGAIMAVGVIVALIAYWIRVRSRTHRRSMKRMTTWPWDHDRLGARAGQDTLEGSNFGARPGLRTWNPARMVEVSASDGGKTRFPIENESPLPQLHLTDPRLAPKDSHAFPLPPIDIDLPAYPGNRSPFVTVPLHANRGREQSVPDMMQEMGTLKITNLVPGDIVTSGGESSRASTALGFSDGSPDLTSEDMGSPTTPRATLVAEDGSTPTQHLPWAPLRTWKTNGGWQEGYMLEDGDDGPLPFPGNNPAVPEPAGEPETKQDGWAISIRSNLVNALNAVVGGSVSQAKTAGTGGDNLTRPPERRTTQRRRGVRGRQESADGISRTGTESSASSPTRWTLEETESGRGVVRFRGDPEQGRPLTEDPFSDDSQVRLENTAAGKQDGECMETFDHARGTANGPPTDVGTTETTLLSPHPPELPSTPSASEPPRGEEPEAALARKTTHHQHRKRTKRRRPAMVRRKSSSQSSAVSVGSDMSRVSSVPSEGLTDAERFAKHVLRERRRRVMEVAVGRGKPSRSKATTISRRRPKEKLKQRMERDVS